MPLNRWRLVREDSEASSFQCLQCRGQFRSLVNWGPHAWKFCPLCATQWEGEQVWDPEAKAKRLRPRTPPDLLAAALVWVFEEQTYYRSHRTSGGWKPYATGRYMGHVPMLKWRPREILQAWQELRRDYAEEEADDARSEVKPWRFFRLRLVALRTSQPEQVVLSWNSPWFSRLGGSSYQGHQQ